MPRLSVNFPESCIDAPDAIAQAEGLSRAQVVRKAILLYLEQRRCANGDAFGIWKERPVDGVAYQEAMRSAWQASVLS
jgi:hypothetical protein